MPFPAVALEPEQQVGSAVAATGYPPKRLCTNAANSARPRGNNLGSKVFQAFFVHCRRRQDSSNNEAMSKIELLTFTQHGFDAFGDQPKPITETTLERLVLRLGMKQFVRHI